MDLAEFNDKYRRGLILPDGIGPPYLFYPDRGIKERLFKLIREGRKKIEKPCRYIESLVFDKNKNRQVVVFVDIQGEGVYDERYIKVPSETAQHYESPIRQNLIERLMVGNPNLELASAKSIVEIMFNRPVKEGIAA